MAGALASLPTWAEETKPAPAPQPSAQKVETLEVTGRQASDTAARRYSTASKIVVSRDELLKQGDSNLSDALKRLPGVSIGGTPGRRGGEIRMRGMGAGFTQIMINGEPVPRGFSLDQLSPEQLERVEVMRAPTAEFSTQAIAGAINIVLRDDVKKLSSELKLSLGSTRGEAQYGTQFQHSDHIDRWAYEFNGGLRRGDNTEQDRTETRGTDALGQPFSRQETSERHARNDGLTLGGRLNGRLVGGDTLSFQPFLVINQTESTSRSTLAQQAQSPAPYAASLDQTRTRFSMFRGFGNWNTGLGEGGRLNVRFGFNANQVENDSTQRQYDANGSLITTRTQPTDIESSGVTHGGKYSTKIGDGQSFASGWDFEWATRRETQQSTLRDAAGNLLPQPNASSGDFKADIGRLALFVQNEAEFSPALSGYAGLRWEGIRTRTEANGADGTSASSVWSPLLHGVWRFGENEKDQLRASLTRTYRAPDTRDLTPRVSVSETNSPNNPDRRGNPDLKPELAWGLEIAVERYLAQGGSLSANLFTRQIDDSIRRVLTQDTDGRWQSRPVNFSRARTQGFELEAKFKLNELVDDALPIELRANWSRYWSKVDGVPGPNNRLASQQPESVNLGFDYRLKSLPLTWGASLTWSPAYDVQVTSTQQTAIGRKRQLDLYGLWRFGPATQLRVALSNVTADDYRSGTRNAVGLLDQTITTLSRTDPNVSATLELKF
jgi:iron complex outermembrane receptor protein